MIPWIILIAISWITTSHSLLIGRVWPAIRGGFIQLDESWSIHLSWRELDYNSDLHVEIHLQDETTNSLAHVFLVESRSPQGEMAIQFPKNSPCLASLCRILLVENHTQEPARRLMARMSDPFRLREPPGEVMASEDAGDCTPSPVGDNKRSLSSDQGTRQCHRSNSTEVIRKPSTDRDGSLESTNNLVETAGERLQVWFTPERSELLVGQVLHLNWNTSYPTEARHVTPKLYSKKGMLRYVFTGGSFSLGTLSLRMDALCKESCYIMVQLDEQDPSTFGRSPPLIIKENPGAGGLALVVGWTMTGFLLLGMIVT